jgi:hypothetical protein
VCDPIGVKDRAGNWVLRAFNDGTLGADDGILELLAEAGSVLGETGLTPRQLADQRAELLEVLKAMHANFKSQHELILLIGSPYFVELNQRAEAAIANAEGAEK